MTTGKVAVGVAAGILAAVLILNLAMALSFRVRCEWNGGEYGIVAGREVCV